jgi:NADH-quinone oxidoreductase subunit N
MTFTDFIALLPFLALAIAALALMLAIAVHRYHRLTANLTLGGLLLSLALVPVAAQVAPRTLADLLIIDGFALFFLGLIVVASLATTVFAYGYYRNRAGHHEEFYLLLLLATLGAGVLAASGHFASLVLGLELLSIALFPLIAYSRETPQALEASLKYLVLSGTSSGFLLFGLALLYSELGTMVFTETLSLVVAREPLQEPFVTGGIAMVLVGIGFKLSLVPFHMWTPDVYEGAPAPVTAFLATVSKGAVLVLLLRYFVQMDAYAYPSLSAALAVVAGLSIIVGNLLALLQHNVKRLLAYSSIAHLGYLLVALLAGGGLAVEAVSYYLTAYFITSLGAFGIVTLLSGSAEREADRFEDYRGLFWHRPWVAGSLSAMLLSLAGIPLTVGFIGKFYVFAAGVAGALWLLLGLTVIGSALGLFFYLRLLFTLYAPATVEASAGGSSHDDPIAASATGFVLTALTLLLIGLGVYPGVLVSIIGASAVSLL